MHVIRAPRTLTILLAAFTAVMVAAFFGPSQSAFAQTYSPFWVEDGGKCLDANNPGGGQDFENGDQVQQWSCTGLANQAWSDFSSCPFFGGCQIQLEDSGLCLDADANHLSQNGDRVQLWQCTGGENQLWNPGTCDATLHCELINEADNKCLDINLNAITNNGAVAQLWDCWGGPNQQFQWT